jgi:hypothetical protein
VSFLKMDKTVEQVQLPSGSVSLVSWQPTAADKPVTVPEALEAEPTVVDGKVV